MWLPPSNVIEAVTHVDPWPFYRQLREERPLYFDQGLRIWVASSYAVINEALHLEMLRVRPPAEPVPQVLRGTAAGEVFAQLVRMTDGSFHAAHKPAVAQAARRWTLADVARASEAATAELWATQDFMHELPVQTMARLLGVPGAQLADTCRWVQAFVRGIAPGADLAAVSLAADAATALMAQGQALGLQPVQAANRIALMQQSLDATAGLLGQTALLLAQHPSLAAAADHSLDAMRGFVAEVERHGAPVQNTRRFAAGRVLLAGQWIAAGQGVLLVLASANRDVALNPQPDQFDPQRGARHSMGFGAGVHVCPGASVAIEIVASCVRRIRAGGQFDACFGRPAGFQPSGNTRIPVFTR
ncbi:cytochrome P450 [Polaromonas sp. UC242_47]|uniref:cytochrome P450 n=1 Tax=Polaromonas sp. UC242_47 TaxID=3374626 RepID=UPI0037A67C36